VEQLDLDTLGRQNPQDARSARNRKAGVRLSVDADQDTIEMEATVVEGHEATRPVRYHEGRDNSSAGHSLRD
jgi:hypothetical protein